MSELRYARCEACRTVVYPPQEFCPGCLAEPREVAAPDTGTVYSVTMVADRAPEWPGYRLSYVDLTPELRVLSRGGIDDRVTIGDQVAVEVRDGVVWYRPVTRR